MSHDWSKSWILTEGHECTTRDRDKLVASVETLRIVVQLWEASLIYKAGDTTIDIVRSVESSSCEEMLEFAYCSASRDFVSSSASQRMSW